MTKLETIEQAIASLEAEDIRKLGEWLDEYRANHWDAQIAADVEAGKFNALIAEAKAEVGLERTPCMTG